MTKKIALDAGHYSGTPGKRSFDGSFMEYEFNHDIQIRIKKYLEAAGVQVILTSPNKDIEVSLGERCKIANKEKVDAFISLHANAYGSSWNQARGWEIYSLSRGSQSEALAKCIHAESMPFLGIPDRGLKVSNFYVLKYTKMPSVLIEHGFFTNKDEVEILKTDVFREKVAIADAKGILKFLGLKFVEKDKYEGQFLVYDSTNKLIGNGLSIEYAKTKVWSAFNSGYTGSYFIYPDRVNKYVCIQNVLDNPKPTNGIVNAASGLKVRTGAATTFPHVEILKNGQPVKVYGTVNSWYIIGKNRYVHSDYIKIVN